jgi:hypothetical protein
VLARYAQAYARELGVAEGRVRAWVAYMILAGVLERATGADAPRFIVKGGVALELRLRDRARATKDIDIVLRDTQADLADTLEQALTGEAFQGFSFRRKGQALLLDNRAVNMEFAVRYRGQPWTSISVDIARAEAGESEVVEAIDLTDVFGVTAGRGCHTPVARYSGIGRLAWTALTKSKISPAELDETLALLEPLQCFRPEWLEPRDEHAV